MTKIKKVAITGSTGMLGSHMLALLHQLDVEIVDVNRDVWDLRNWKQEEDLRLILKSVDVFFHFAAALPIKNVENINRIFDVNVRSCTNIANFCLDEGVSLIFISSATVYDNPHAINILEADKKVSFGLGGFYGFSKLLGEEIVNHFVSQGLRAILLRPSSIYGTGLAKGKLVSHILDQALAGDSIKIAQPNNQINFIHASDVAIACIKALRCKAWGIYNCGASENVSILELAQTCIRISGSGNIIKPYDNNDLGYVRFDLNSEKAEKVFGYSPVINISRGIEIMSSGRYDLPSELLKELSWEKGFNQDG